MPTHIRFADSGAIISTSSTTLPTARSPPFFAPIPGTAACGVHTRFHDVEILQHDPIDSKMHLDPSPTPTHTSFDIDQPLDDYEIPRAREYVKRVKEETRGEIKAFLAWQSIRSRTAESIQDFVQRFPQYANPSTRPPVLRPLTAEILSRCDPSSGGFMANVFDRSLFPPQAVRTGALDLEMAHSYAPPPAPGLTPRETASVHHSRRRTDGEHADLTSLYVPAQPVKRRSSGRITSDVATNGRVDHAKDRLHLKSVALANVLQKRRIGDSPKNTAVPARRQKRGKIQRMRNRRRLH